MLLNISLQLLVGPAVGLKLPALLLGEVLDQLIGAEARLTGLTIHQGIVEVAHMAAGNPDVAVHQDGAVQADIVLVLLYKFLPPRALDVVFKLHAQRAVIPAVGEAAVNFAARVDKAAPLAKRDELVHG